MKRLRFAQGRRAAARVLAGPSSVLAVALFGLFMAGEAAAVEVTCRNGDALGWSVSTGGDFDGDGVTDVAAGAPCARGNGNRRAGRAYVYSGATGDRLLSLEGTDVDQQLGAALSFIDDVDGDGRNEIAVGSSTFDSPKPGGGTYNAGGKLEVYNHEGEVVWTLFGANPQANLGEAVDGLHDIDGDGIGDVVVGASGASVDLGDAGLQRVGIGYLVSGADGSIIGRSEGRHVSDAWANVVAGVGDMDGDLVPDIAIAASNAEVFPDDGAPAGGTTTSTTILEPSTTLPETTTTLPDVTTSTSTTTTTTTTTSTTTLRDAGIVQIISGAFPYEEVARFRGADRQRLGRAVAGIADLDGDLVDELWLGSPGFAAAGLSDSGKITLERSTLANIDRTEPTPQAGAGFGTAIAVVGRINADTIQDIVASAPTATVGNGAQTGRVHAYSGSGTPAQPLWTQNGPVGGARMGQSLDGGILYDNDAVGDVVVGVPGDAPRGRRNAGSVRILSGANGALLKQFNGRRGGETRIFVAGESLARRPAVQSFDLRGRRREVDLSPFRGQSASSLSMDVLDEAIATGPNDIYLAVGSGRGGEAPRVNVYRAGRRRWRVSSFLAELSGYSGGVNVAAGNFVNPSTDDFKDEIVVGPADATSGGNIDVALYQRSFDDPIGRFTWALIPGRDPVRVFSATDKLNGTLISAVGVNLAGGDVTDDAKDEFVVGAASGLPVVRVFSRTGSLRHTWLAFPAQGTDGGPNSGVTVAVGNIDGNADNRNEIVTAVADGQLWIRAYRADGTLVTRTNGNPVNIFVTQYPTSYRGGLRVAVADVDFDGAGEILVAPASELAGPVLALELDGSLVSGWKPFFPLGPGVDSGVSLVATDSFVRR
ncbi:MAG TPA: integrin alpha [Candidatus Limnocylindrales bacterium]|nr:integrin alpha [Candidatus Limnocylindrales bacterium]